MAVTMNIHQVKPDEYESLPIKECIKKDGLKWKVLEVQTGEGTVEITFFPQKE